MHNIKIKMNEDKSFTIEDTNNAKRKRTDEVEINEVIETSNPYQILIIYKEEDRMEESTSPPPLENSKNAEKEKIKKPYNLFFEVGNNVKSIFAQIHQLAPNVVTKMIRNQIKILTECLDSFRRLQKNLESNKIPVMSMDLKDPKPIKFVIRRLPLCITASEIAEELKKHELVPLGIAYMKNRRTK